MQQKVCHSKHAYKEGMKYGLNGENKASEFKHFCEGAPKFSLESYDKYFQDGLKDGLKFFCDKNQVVNLGRKHLYQYRKSQFIPIKQMCGKISANSYQASYTEHQKKVCQFDYWKSLGKKDALSGMGPENRVQALNLCKVDKRDNLSRAYTSSYEKQKSMMDKASW